MQTQDFFHLIYKMSFFVKVTGVCVYDLCRHNPKNNTFTSVYETPINMNAKKQAETVSEVSGH